MRGFKKALAGVLTMFMLLCLLPVGKLEAKPPEPVRLSNPEAADNYRLQSGYGKSYLAVNKAGKKLLYLEGAPYERGYAEGWLLGRGVYRMTNDYVNNFLGNLAGLLPEGANLPPSALRKVLTQLAVAQEHAIPEEYRQEMRGIAEGARDRGYNVTYQDLLMLNAGYDVFGSVEFWAGALLCNEFAVFGKATTDGRLYHGRDFMFSTGGDVFSDEALIKVIKPTSGYTLVTSSAPAFVGFPTGLNAKGISCGMDVVLSRLNRPLITGMGTLLICRNVVQHAATLQQAVNMIRNTSRGCSWLYMVADGKIPNAVVLETVADRVLPQGEELLSTVEDLVPGLDTLLSSLNALVPGNLVNGLLGGAGGLLTGVGDLVAGLVGLVPVLGDFHPDQGVMVRAADYVDPPGLEKYRITLPVSDPLLKLQGRPVDTTTIAAFPLQREKKPDLIAMTNHYMLPPMVLTNMGLTYHTIATWMGGGRESEWRYNTMLDLLLKYYGRIDQKTGMWLIDFLNPARCNYYGTDRRQSVKGHHVLMDNKSLEMWSLHGYYHQPWQHVDLKWFLNPPAFTDTANSFAKEDIQFLARYGVIRGVTKTQFDCLSQLSRAQFAAWVARALKLEPSDKAPNFKDVPSGHWAVQEIRAAAEAGIVKGFNDGSFEPETPINREQLAAMLGRALAWGCNADLPSDAQVRSILARFQDQSQITPGLAKEVALAADRGIVQGMKGKFDPAGVANREQAAAMLARVFRELP